MKRMAMELLMALGLFVALAWLRVLLVLVRLGY
jgi:hypothetical protein